jgi:hypothetical protein
MPEQGMFWLEWLQDCWRRGWMPKRQGRQQSIYMAERLYQHWRCQEAQRLFWQVTLRIPLVLP